MKNQLIELKSFVNDENLKPIPVTELTLREAGRESTRLQFFSSFDSVTVALSGRDKEDDITLTRDQIVAIGSYVAQHLQTWNT